MRVYGPAKKKHSSHATDEHSFVHLSMRKAQRTQVVNPSFQKKSLRIHLRTHLIVPVVTKKRWTTDSRQMNHGAHETQRPLASKKKRLSVDCCLRRVHARNQVKRCAGPAGTRAVPSQPGRQTLRKKRWRRSEVCAVTKHVLSAGTPRTQTKEGLGRKAALRGTSEPQSLRDGCARAVSHDARVLHAAALCAVRALYASARHVRRDGSRSR